MVSQDRPACAPSSTRNSKSVRSSCCGTPHSSSWYLTMSGSAVPHSHRMRSADRLFAAMLLTIGSGYITKRKEVGLSSGRCGRIDGDKRRADLVAWPGGAFDSVSRTYETDRKARRRSRGRCLEDADREKGMGFGNSGEATAERGLGGRREPVPSEVPLHELDAPDPRGPGNDEIGRPDCEGVRIVAQTIFRGGWRIRDQRQRRQQERASLHDRKHGPCPRAIRIRGSSEGPERLRVAPPKRRQKRRGEWLLTGGGTR